MLLPRVLQVLEGASNEPLGLVILSVLQTVSDSEKRKDRFTRN